MRTIATVYGIGEHKAGIGKKTGKKYDFTEFAIAYPCPDFNGLKCETVAIDSDVIGERKIGVGDKIDLVMHQANFKTYVDAIVD